MIEKNLVTKIEPFEEDVVVENPPHDWERSCVCGKMILNHVADFLQLHLLQKVLFWWQDISQSTTTSSSECSILVTRSFSIMWRIFYNYIFFKMFNFCDKIFLNHVADFLQLHLPQNVLFWWQASYPPFWELIKLSTILGIWSSDSCKYSSVQVCKFENVYLISVNCHLNDWKASHDTEDILGIFVLWWVQWLSSPRCILYLGHQYFAIFRQNRRFLAIFRQNCHFFAIFRQNRRFFAIFRRSDNCRQSLAPFL